MLSVELCVPASLSAGQQSPANTTEPLRSVTGSLEPRQVAQVAPEVPPKSFNTKHANRMYIVHFNTPTVCCTPRHRKLKIHLKIGTLNLSISIIHYLDTLTLAFSCLLLCFNSCFDNLNSSAIAIWNWSQPSFLGLLWKKKHEKTWLFKLIQKQNMFSNKRWSSLIIQF